MTDMRGLDIPRVQMGNVSSDDLFEQREQELFDLYERHQKRYKVVLDVGANIGIHACFMARLGWQVLAFEPDPEHLKHLHENLKRNGVKAKVYNCALASWNGTATWVRVLGNTTANHIKGMRDCHGPVEEGWVPAEHAEPYVRIADFAKIDVEGGEAAILCCVPPGVRCEFLVEIGSEENARRIYEHFRSRRMWRQADQQWSEVSSLDEMPTHYKHGSLFIGEQP